MRFENGAYYCVLCGERVDRRTDDEARVKLRDVPGRLLERVVFVDGKEVHRCTVASPN